jgi:hypothetical protein
LVKRVLIASRRVAMLQVYVEVSQLAATVNSTAEIAREVSAFFLNVARRSLLEPLVRILWTLFASGADEDGSGDVSADEVQKMLMSMLASDPSALLRMLR